MEHSLDDSLHLDTEMGVDFVHGGDVVSSDVISIKHNDMPMEFDQLEEPIMMETESEIIVPDLISDEFPLGTDHHYDSSSTNIQSSNPNANLESNEPAVLTRVDSMMDLTFEPQSLITPTTSVQTQFVAIKPRPAKQIAIAPKPTAIAPKLVRPGGATLLKKVSLAAVQPKIGQPVFTQLGKQLVMVPASSGHKITLSNAGQAVQAQLLSKNIMIPQGAKKPLLAKVFLQANAQNPSEQSAVLTKIMPSGANPTVKYVTMQPKTVPTSIANKDNQYHLVMTSPSKQGIRYTRPTSVIPIKSSPTKLLPVTKAGTTQKIVLANPQQSVLIKSAAAAQAQKNATAQHGEVPVLNVQSDGQRSQLHQIIVPGKGVQYIRLINNQSLKSSAQPANAQGKVVLLADNKGNVLQMPSEKSASNPPPLVVTSGAGKLATKPQQKLVRIAPVVVKAAKPVKMPQAQVQSTQSLLAPIVKTEVSSPPIEEVEVREEREEVEREDSKAALRALIEDTVREETVEDTQDVSMDSSTTFDKTSASNQFNDTYQNFLNIQVSDNTFPRPQSLPSPSDNAGSLLSELDGRPRRPCNCTKSRCLKLYCDCFANGEFCNNCNCNNCHNNLDFEEMRQKAIRGCLDRNPNAFRPKIGKAKAGGPAPIRRHNKGCNCKRSGCLKNYCECFEAKIACSGICKCVGCRNVEEAKDEHAPRYAPIAPRPEPEPATRLKQPCSFVTDEVIEAVCQCLVAAGGDAGAPDPVRAVLDEFARCLSDVISAASHTAQVTV